MRLAATHRLGRYLESLARGSNSTRFEAPQSPRAFRSHPRSAQSPSAKYRPLAQIRAPEKAISQAANAPRLFVLRLWRTRKKQVDCLECRLQGCQRNNQCCAGFNAGCEMYRVGFDQFVHGGSIGAASGPQECNARREAYLNEKR